MADHTARPLTIEAVKIMEAHTEIETDNGTIIFDDKGMKITIKEAHGITNDYIIGFEGNTITYNDFIVIDGKFESEMHVDGEIEPIRQFFEIHDIQTAIKPQTAEEREATHESYIYDICCYLWDLYRYGYPCS